MTRDLRICFVVALLLLSSCTSIPDAVLEQDRQRRRLLAQCEIFIKTFSQATDPTRVNLDPCRQHQSPAYEIIDYYASLSKERAVSPEEIELFKRAFDDLMSVYIELCYADVRLGKEIKDYQGRTGTAACDRLVDRKRHRETLDAIK